jgi:predicted enzyme related to lactoylglutathione lyase
MSEENPSRIGAIMWVDQTSPNAPELLEFYKQVVGWTVTPVAMGDYDDWCVNEPATGKAVAGICNARGVNADLPPGWIVYVTVDDVDAAAERAVALGGEVLRPPSPPSSSARYCIVRDPGGSVVALYQS